MDGWGWFFWASWPVCAYALGLWIGTTTARREYPKWRERRIAKLEAQAHKLRSEV